MKARFAIAIAIHQYQLIELQQVQQIRRMYGQHDRGHSGQHGSSNFFHQQIDAAGGASPFSIFSTITSGGGRGWRSVVSNTSTRSVPLESIHPGTLKCRFVN